MRRHGLLSAPGGLARRFCGDAWLHDLFVTLLRNHSRPDNLARHRTLRRFSRILSRFGGLFTQEYSREKVDFLYNWPPGEPTQTD
jgi:hypothetical protein